MAEPKKRLPCRMSAAVPGSSILMKSPVSAISVGLCSDKELNMLPRTLLIAAERDILRDQGLNLSRRMGGKIRRIEYKGAVHLFITVPGQDRAFAVADGRDVPDTGMGQD